jgi:glutathione S-transferase
LRATIFVIPGSHSSAAGRLMLERKRIPYRRVDLPPAASRIVLRALGFPGVTVPAVRLDGARIQGTRTLSRALDALVPDPPLFPRDPERRRAVERAEAWGDDVLQPVPRRLIWWALRRDHDGLGTFLEGPVLGLPPKLAVATAPPLAWAARRLNRVSDDSMRADLQALPGLLDRADKLVDEGVLDADEPNAATFQVATSVRLLMCFDDFRVALGRRPVGRVATRVVPEYPGRVGSVLPAELLGPLRA